MADLYDFIDCIITRKKGYCSVCFRTEEERRLVPPVALSKFIKLSALKELSGNESVCTFCERQAESAMRLHRALGHARHVSDVLGALLAKGLAARAIAFMLPSKIRGLVSGPSSVKRGKLLPTLRSYQTYRQTDTLAVDVGTGDRQKKDTCSEPIVIEDEPETHAPRLVPIEKLLKSPPAPLPPSPPPAPTTHPAGETPMMLYSMDKVNTQNLLILPDNDSGNIAMIPVLLSSGTIVSLSSEDNVNGMPTTDKQTEKHGVNVNNDIANLNMVENGSNFVQKASNTGNNYISVYPLRRNSDSNDNNVIDNGEEAGNVIFEGDGSSDYFAIVTNPSPKNGEDRMCEISDLRSLKGLGVATPAIRRDPNIDWEDKIPMDVITFMDADFASKVAPPSHTRNIGPPPPYTGPNRSPPPYPRPTIPPPPQLRPKIPLSPQSRPYVPPPLRPRPYIGPPPRPRPNPPPRSAISPPLHPRPVTPPRTCSRPTIIVSPQKDTNQPTPQRARAAPSPSPSPPLLIERRGGWRGGRRRKRKCDDDDVIVLV